MSLKRKLISGIISAFAVVTFTGFASAQDTDKSQQDSTQKQEKRERRGGFGKRNGMGKGMRGGMMMRGFKALNLTDAQKEQIRTIMQANKPDKSQFESLRSLREAKRSGTLTAEQQTQLDAFKAQRKQNAENVKTQVLAILTTEQRAQLEAQKEQWKQKREERKQMRQERKSKQTTEKDSDDLN